LIKSFKQTPLNSTLYIDIAKAWVQKTCSTSVAATFDLSVPNLEKVISEIFISRNSRGYQSTSEMAKMKGLERDELFDRLHKDGMLEKYKDQKHFLTRKGFELGGRFATDGKVSDGYWSVWPESILGTQKNSAVELKKVIIDVIQWIKSGGNSNYVEKWAHVISENQDDGYLSTSKMIAKDDSNSSVVLQILEFKRILGENRRKLDTNS
jgi:ribulose bisphosphate carboxylase small subunit